MKRNVLVFSVSAIFLVSCVSCQSDKTTDKDTLDEAELVDITGKIREDGTSPTLSKDQVEVIEYQKDKKPPSQTKNKLDYSIKEGSFDGFLVGNWTFDIQVDVNEGVDEKLKGQILQLHGDETFNIIEKDVVIQEGNFKYDRHTTALRLIPTTGQASEWTVNAMNTSIVLVGTPTFNNNMTQIRLLEGIVEQ